MAAREVSIEYAHIYTNNHIGEEHRLSVRLLGEVCAGYVKEDISLMVMVDDYSFPDCAFDYDGFSAWLCTQGYGPDLMIRESALIPACDVVIDLIEDPFLKGQIQDYIAGKRYPCSLFIATWYLARLGYIKHALLKEGLVAKKLVNILPLSFKPFEDKGFEIIGKTKYRDALERIENRYFEGRLVA